MTPYIDLASDFYRLDKSAVSGYAFDRARQEQRFTVELLIDGVQIGSALADHASGRARDLGFGDGCYGFTFVLPETLLAHAEMVEARLANLGAAVGRPLMFNQPGGQTTPADATPLQGEVEWSGGLRFTGWAESADGDPPEISALIDGKLVAQARANGWRHVDRPRPAAKFAFDIHLPQDFADGRVWTASFCGGKGVELAGSPVTFVATPGGIDSTLFGSSAPPGQRVAAQFFDRVMPGALPFSAYPDARQSFLPSETAPTGLPLGVLVLDGDGIEATLASLDRQAHACWTCGILPPAETALTFLPQDLADFLIGHAEGVDWFLFVAPGAALNVNALTRFAAAAGAPLDASVIYADYEIADAHTRPWPIALPAFDYERMLEQGYFAPMFLLPRATVERAIEISAGNIFRLANLPMDEIGARVRALHLPGPAMMLTVPLADDAGRLLAEATSDHLRHRRLDATVQNLSGATSPRCQVRRRPNGRAKVSIVIPTRNRHDLLKACLDSILPATARVKSEIIVLDNDSSDPQTVRYLRQIAQDGVTVVHAPGPFNFSRLNNEAASLARGEILCFLNNDVVARDTAWLEEMVSRLSDETTGVVGAKLLWPSGIVQHGGVTLGVNFSCVHDFRDRIETDPGYHGALEVARETGAVTAACMLTRRSHFLELGGFDALRFPINFNDVDYCLRVHARGLRVVFTPHACLVHHESVSRGRDQTRDAAGRFRRELWMLRHKWGRALAADPFYNPLLALSDPPYSALAWPPGPLAPRRNLIEPGVQPPPGF